MGISPRRVFRLCQKELRETLRDRRTIVTLVLMPLLVYPILSMTLNRFLLTSRASTTASFFLGVSSETEEVWLRQLLEDPGSRPPQAVLDTTESPPATFAIIGPQQWSQYSDELDPEYALSQKWFDAYVRLERDPQPTVDILVARDDANGQAAQRILVDRLNYWNYSMLRNTANQLLAKPIPQISISAEKFGKAADSSLLASIVPLVLVLMTITGAVYPAIDLTAGERERGTMEALIASPVPRGAVLLSKYVAVVTVAMLTAIANLGAMFVTFWASGLMQRLMGTGETFPWLQFLQIFVLLFLFSGFFSALLLTLTSFARSFKEAQAYLIPLMLVSLAPGVLSLMPGVELTPILSVVPLLNIILLSREILAGNVFLVPALLAVITTIFYAIAALAIATKLFGNDAVQRTSEQSFVTSLLRPANTRPVPTITEAATTLALLVPVYFIVSTVLARSAPQDSTTEAIHWALISNAIALTLVFGGLPFLVSWFCRDQTGSTFRIARPQIGTILAAILLGLGLWTWAHEVFLFGDAIGIRGLDAETIERVTKTADRIRMASPWLVILAFAVVPAVVEELCFRGYLFSALASKLTPFSTILATAFLFGLFHVVTGNVLLIERFLPTTMLGVVLGWLAWRSGSVIPGVCLHFTHNALLNLVMLYKDQLLKWGIGVAEDSHLPALWIAGGSLTVFIALGITFISTRARFLQSPRQNEAQT